MKHFVKVTLPCLTLAFGLAACENAADIDRKPVAAETMIKAALETCAIKDNEIAYASRLRSVLMDVRTKALDKFTNNKITICLDQRIDNQANGTWDSRIVGVYNQKESVISLPDSLREKVDSAKALDSLVYFMPKTKTDAFLYAARYYCGRGCTSKVDWRMETKFDQDSIAKNPQLRTPPLKSSAGGQW